MRWRSAIALLGPVICVAVSPNSAAQDVVKEYGPALVLIRVFSKHGEGSLPVGYGTGWLVSYDGYVMSAAHVITGNNKVSWDKAVFRGEILGKMFPMRVVDILSDFRDAALLKMEWNPDDRAEMIFDRFRSEILPTATPVVLLGFANPDVVKPSLLNANISQSGGAMYLGDRPVPHGFSGGPILVLEDGPDVVAMALATSVDEKGREIQGEYLPEKYMEKLLTRVREYGDMRKPYPRWLPQRPAGTLHHSEQLSNIVKKLTKGQTVLLAGGPGMETRELAVEIGYRLWEEHGRLPATILYVDASEQGGTPKSVSDILADLLRQLGKDYLVSAPDYKKREKVREILMEATRTVIILEHVEKKDDLENIVDIRGRASVLATSSNTFPQTHLDNRVILLALSENECVNLFKEESRLRLDNKADLRSVQEICKLLGGIPNAIRWVAAAAGPGRGGISLSRILTEVRRGSIVKYLSEVHIAFDVAYNNLEKDEQHVLTTASVIGGESFEGNAAAAVSQIPHAELLLYRLAWVSLLESVGNDRFRLNPLIKTFAGVKLSDARPKGFSPEREMVRYYLKYLDAAELQREFSNILHALQTCQKFPDETEQRRCLLKGVPRVAPFMRTWGQWELHQEWVARWYEAAKTEADLRGQRAALRALAEVEIKRGNNEEARRLLQKAISLPTSETDLETARVYYALANLEFKAIFDHPEKKKKQLEIADSLVRKGLDISEGLKEDVHVLRLKASGYHDLGIIADEAGDSAKAREEFERSLSILENVGQPGEVIAPYYHIAKVDFRDGHLIEAKAGFARALELARTERDEEARAHSLVMLALISLEEKNKDLALKYLSEAVVVYERLESDNLQRTREIIESIRTGSSTP